MSSAIYYKFKSQKSESRIAFDGTGISVLDLKREIILANDLGKALDIDIQIYDPNGEDEYHDDHLIPRSSAILVKRVPLIRGAKSKFPRYLAGGTSRAQFGVSETRKVMIPGSWTKGAGGFSKRFDGKEEPKQLPQPAAASAPVILPNSISGEEGASLQAVLAAEETNWQETQEHMAQQQRVFSAPRYGGGGPRKPFPQVVQEKEVPPGYICYRCGVAGHWIHDCPTNNDPDFDKRRIKRTTGIPRSFLKAVEGPSEGSGPLAQGIMVTPDGGYVMAQPDKASWEKQKARMKTMTQAEIAQNIPPDHPLACPLCSKLVSDAVKTPCCQTTFCEECLHTYLSENGFICPHCKSNVPSLNSLIADLESRSAAREYIEVAMEAYRNQEIVIANEVKDEEEAIDPEQTQPLQPQQPGTDIIAPDSAFMEQKVKEMQAQLAQLQRLMNDANIPMQARKNAQNQANVLTVQLREAQQLLHMAHQIINAANAATAEATAPRNYRPGWTNPFPNQQPPSVDSAYQRQPVNPRRRTQKRPAEWDLEGRDPKFARYWE